jgi:cell division protein FtsB
MLTSPSGGNLENKYLELLSQVSKVTSQIEKIKTSNSSLQNDIYSMKSGNGKRSMYG